VLDRDFTGEKIFELVQELAASCDVLDRMGECARRFAHPEAARRAAEVLEEVAR
jgi:UDP-N-acetylglucosamine:LPS N-acetylglucosamine transferase